MTNMKHADIIYHIKRIEVHFRRYVIYKFALTENIYCEPSCRYNLYSNISYLPKVAYLYPLLGEKEFEPHVMYVRTT
jgi:hypothetical protein